MSTKIAWTDEVWNPVTGCTKVSAGCKFCYAETFARRQMGSWRDRAFTDVRCHEDRLNAPLRWRKPRRVFVNSMSDLFHPDVPDEFILNVFTVMAIARQHTFQVLTKRPERMRTLLSSWRADDLYTYWHGYSGQPAEIEDYPLPNVWAGVSVEDQPTADARIPLLLQTPAAVRFVSYEPALGLIDIRWRTASAGGFVQYLPAPGPPDPLFTGPAWAPRRVERRYIDWIIVGGESGLHARPCDVAWIRSVIQQCKASGTPCFVKQLGDHPVGWWSNSLGPTIGRLKSRKGGDPAEWPEDLRVREYPR